jgi:transcriptional regulator EpsA
MSALPKSPSTDPVHYLRIAQEAVGIATHADLWRWLRHEVQSWVPHEALLIGWGDFQSGDLQHDIVSSLPGLRTRDWSPKAIRPLVSFFRDHWVAGLRRPCAIDLAECGDLLARSPEHRSPGDAILRLRVALVHGVSGHAQGSELMVAALGIPNGRPPGDGHALKLLLPFIEGVIRRLPPPPPLLRVVSSEGARTVPLEAPMLALSGREQQIMGWVAMGKTNPEIGSILQISEFTVKNHLKSIFAKLDATNRAQAVAKLTRIRAHA